ncbi:hypothetical protein EST38_g4558 [Candolleomyces aberdarensis]|uniref:Sulfite efflux pump SSU1 n=1 Tax=Candolleomyces aberdarensis TaxID=2316362 RepID=A0A4Q2DMB5_9AGAR|nr:hypothetical protein EST38_g4558 [Candolleomyces aberdarensis]
MTVKGPSGWRRLTAAFSTLSLKAHPALFAVIMGTGSVSNLLHIFPYGKGSRGLMIASLAFFFLNLILFCIFFFLALAKYVMHPDRWKAVIYSPVTSPYLGTFPMGLTTLINVAVEVINIHFEFGGKGFLYFIWAVWWLDVIMSALCCWVGVHAMMVNQKHSLDTMSARWLLPVVTLIVASSSGGVLAPAIQKYSTYHCLITTVASVFLVAVGLTLALMVLTIYLARLIIHNIPPGHGVLSVFLPLGPTGQAGFAILLQGLSFKTILPYSHSGSSEFLGSSTVGDFLYLACISIAFILWSLATMWMMYALLACHSTVFRAPVQFKIAFWGLVFPNGVYANLTILLGEIFDSHAFRIYGAIYACAVIVLWASIAARSLVDIKELITRSNELPFEAPSQSSSAGTSQTDLGFKQKEGSG